MERGRKRLECWASPTNTATHPTLLPLLIAYYQLSSSVIFVIVTECDSPSNVSLAESSSDAR